MNQRMDSIKRVFALCKAQKSKLTMSVIFSIIGFLLSLVPFYIVYMVIKALIADILTLNQLTQYAVVALITIVLRVYMLAKSSEYSHIVAFNVLYKLRKDTSEKIMRLPLGYFSGVSAGVLKKTINEDIEKLELFIAHNIPEISGAIVTPVLTTIYMFFMDWRMGIAAVLMIPLMFLAMSLSFKGSDTLMVEYYESSKQMNASIVEYVVGMPVIKAFGRSMSSYKKLTEYIRKYAKFEYDWGVASTPYMTMVSMIAEIGVITIFPVGLYLSYRGILEPEMLLLFILLGIGYAAPLMKLMMFMGMFGQISKGEEAIHALLTEKELNASGREKISAYDISFENVTFSYDERVILDDLSINFEPGQITALIGPSGAGKTTIGRLIPRFWDVDMGSIKIGGKNIKSLDNQNLMENVSFVFQDVFLFNTSIMNNIRMGKPNASDEEVYAAAKQAQCHDFVSKLDDGYQTLVGEKAVKLSGGEKQRIALARAILKDAPIVIFDEATSAADPENEDKIQEALNKLIKDKTVIVIAHRLSSITEANKIVIIDSGKAVAQGNHKSLLEQSKIYQNMWFAHIGSEEWSIMGGEKVV
ncbi:ABC transporter ATP-binding protein [Acidaminobacter sp. JC074]|uniref:ABC transporter ATP-binding protein n=1 Tax=Acidaminobacter sp. JC074 TaxID=2530199 RepID=UPI001F10F2F6|nr:ABC transporter ATP-binding protein [Acidaminobacter sp. JC074]MCH4891031.1 ABC transporter ATP-binding protein [Acidaminobacter sp. JC074]